MSNLPHTNGQASGETNGRTPQIDVPELRGRLHQIRHSDSDLSNFARKHTPRLLDEIEALRYELQLRTVQDDFYALMVNEEFRHKFSVLLGQAKADLE